MRQFRLFLCPEEAGLPLHGSPESLGMEGMNKTTPTEVIECILDAGEDAKTENLV